MKLIAALTITWLMATLPTAAHADDDEPSRSAPEVERVSTALEIRLGAGSAPYFTRSLPEVRGHGIVLLLSAGYRFDERHSIAAEAPLLAISVRQPAGAYLDEFAAGNVALSYRHQRALLATPMMRLSVHAGASLALPTAERSGSASLLAGRALRVGSALDGFRRPELYTEGVVPVVASAGATIAQRWFTAVASLRLPLLPRFSDAELPEVRTRALGVTAVLQLEIAAEVTRWLQLSLAAASAIEAVAVAASPRAAPRGQLTLEPAFTVRLPRGVQLGMRFVWPTAGPLGGSTYAGSFVLAHRR